MVAGESPSWQAAGEMDGSAAQVHELHRKFEALNEDVAAALKQQHEALAGVAAAGGGRAGGRDALRLATRAADWREDVAALARHIDSQLQHSRALREHHASTQLQSPAAAASADRQLADDESARLRRLRSDLRLLQGFRVGQGGGGAGAAADDTVRQPPAPLALGLVAVSRCRQHQLQAFLEWSVKREKAAAAAAAASLAVPLAVELFERRRELMGLIAEDVLRDKLERDADMGCVGRSPLAGGCQGLTRRRLRRTAGISRAWAASSRRPTGTRWPRGTRSSSYPCPRPPPPPRCMSPALAAPSLPHVSLTGIRA